MALTNGTSTATPGLKVQERRVGILIGGSGLIGGTLAHYFKTKTPDEIDIRAPSSKKLSIRNAEDIKSYVRRVRPHFIINTAIASLDSNAQLALEVNYMGAINLARAASAVGIPYIHVSSAATLPAGENLSEDDHLPLSPGLPNYAKSKLMAEQTLAHMARHHGLDYTAIRLAIVYGEHDHKIQGFHRLFFSIADEAMPFMMTQRGVTHSYSNANKLPYFVHHLLDNRAEFSGETYHFVDKNSVELAELILTIRSYLELKRPREIYVPYAVVKGGVTVLKQLLRLVNGVGIEARLPAELQFLKSFYTSQTLSSDKLRRSSFVDPRPDETIFTKLPKLVIYYLTRWSQLNLITTFNEEYFVGEDVLTKEFNNSPGELLDSMHSDSTAPFVDLVDLLDNHL